MMRIAFKIDWLTLTGKTHWASVGALGPSYQAAHDVASFLLDVVTDGNCVVRVDRPSPHYSYGFKDLHSGLHVSIGKDLSVQGWMIKASGKVFSEPQRAERLVKLAINNGWNCSRMDFAIDIFDTDVTPAQFWSAWKRAHPENTQKSIALIEGATGDTFYLGSRSSNKFMRIYDKAGEQGLAMKWVRMEMELKGTEASHALETAQYGLRALIPTVQQYLDLAGTKVLDTIWLLADEFRGTGYWPANVKSSRERWFNGDVLSALRKWAVEDKEAVMEWILHAHDEAVIAAEHARRIEYEVAIL